MNQLVTATPPSLTKNGHYFTHFLPVVKAWGHPETHPHNYLSHIFTDRKSSAECLQGVGVMFLWSYSRVSSGSGCYISLVILQINKNYCGEKKNRGLVF